MRDILGFVVFVAKVSVTRRRSFPGNRNKMDYNTQKSRGEAVVGGKPALPGSSGSSAAREERTAQGWRGPLSTTRAAAWHAGNCSSMQVKGLGRGFQNPRFDIIPPLLASGPQVSRYWLPLRTVTIPG